MRARSIGGPATRSGRSSAASIWTTASGGIRELPAASGGGWRARLVRWLEPSREPERKMHGWKDPLHEVATFVALASESTTRT